MSNSAEAATKPSYPQVRVGLLTRITTSDLPFSMIFKISDTYDNFVQNQSPLVKSLTRRHHPSTIVTTDFVVLPEDGVKRQEIVCTDPSTQIQTMVGLQFTGEIDGEERTIISIDHHDGDLRMQRNVSSANLAIEWMNHIQRTSMFTDSKGGESLPRVVISHLDCDSVSAVAILSGIIPRGENDKNWKLLGDAVIAADHTGDVNVIADMMQGLDEIMGEVESTRNEEGVTVPQGSVSKKSLALALQALRASLDLATGKIDEEDLPVFAKEALARRRASREKAKKFISNVDEHGEVHDPETSELLGEFRNLGNGVYFIKVLKGSKIPTELLPGLLPDESIAIVEANPHRKDRDRWEVAIRAGKRFLKEGGNFHNLGLNQTPYRIGGRWDAGSSGRGRDTMDKWGNSNEELSQIINRFSSLTLMQELKGSN